MSLVDTVTKAFVPVHREGWPFVAGFFLTSILIGWLWDPLFWIGIGLTLWCAYFFRDPPRVSPVDDSLVLSAADGVISAIGQARPPEELELGSAERLRISVFMNVFSVHVNRAPVRGTITTVAYRPGKFLNADMDKASTENERNGFVIETDHGPIAAVQVAGLVARRIVPFRSQGDVIAAGDRIGLIRFGSRVDVYLPDGAVPQVFLGQMAVAGETIIAAFDRPQPTATTRTS